MIEYKGYVANVEYDDSVGRLHGRVVNSGPYAIAIFEATDVEGIRDEFRRSIDEYLASCEEDGVEAMKPFSGKLNVRLGSELHHEVARAAQNEAAALKTDALEQTLPASLSDDLLELVAERDRLVGERQSLQSVADTPPVPLPVMVTFRAVIDDDAVHTTPGLAVAPSKLTPSMETVAPPDTVSGD